MQVSLCAKCSSPTHKEEGFPYCDDNGKHYCLDCALKLGLLDPLDYLEYHGIGIFHHATHNAGVITAFRKCGKGFRKYEIATVENVVL